MNRNNNNNNNAASSSNARANRRETRSQFHDRNKNNDNSNNNNNNNNNNKNNNNNNEQRNNQFDKRKHQQQTQNMHQQQQNQHQSYHQQHQSQDRRDRSGQRDQSSQRDRSTNRGGQFPDSSVGRDGFGPAMNLGAVKFNPGYPTRELPPIETKVDPSKKFTGRCRLFVGNLPHNTTEEQVRKLFVPFGEIGELYLGPKSSFAFVKMDTRQNAEAARDALDCGNFDGRSLRVRLAAHAAAIRVKHLSPVVTNELLAYSFRYFGEIERAVVVVDDKGKSTGEGIVEYSKKQSALFALKKCQFECFMLTASPMPVLVEPYDQHDEDEGLPEKSVNKNSIEYKEQRDVGPRFADQGTFEHSFALKWKELYNQEKQKRERLEQEIEEARKSLQDQIEYSRLEHDEMQLRTKLQKLEDSRLKLQQQKEQNFQRDDPWRQQELLLRQQEDELRRQQMGDTSYLTQQDTSLRSQAQLLQDSLGTADPSVAADIIQQDLAQAGLAHEVDPTGANQMMGAAPRTFADVAMMGMNQQYMQQQQQLASQMGLQGQGAQAAMYAGYIPPPPLQGDSLGGANFASYQQQSYVPPQPVSQASSSTGTRQQKMTRSFVNSSNNINVVGRPKKRGRY